MYPFGRGLALLSLTTLLFATAPGCGRIGPWPEETSGTTSDLNAIWGFDDQNIWAVGSVGTILKWNGYAWLPQASGTTAYLNDVWGSDANNVWAVGDGVILRWTGTSWLPQPDGETGHFETVGGTDRDNVWVGGYGSDGRPLVLRWNGAGFSAQSVDSGQPIHCLYAATPDRVFVGLGINDLARWDGTAWNVDRNTFTSTPLGMWGSDASNVWTVGGFGSIARWNGVSWTRQTSPNGNYLSDVFGISDGLGAGRILLYAAGVQGTLLSSDGTKWIEETLYTKESLNGVWGTTRRTANATEVDVWVVGQKGTILRKAP